MAVGEDVDIGVATGDKVLYSKYSTSGESGRRVCVARGSGACRPAGSPARSRAQSLQRAARRPVSLLPPAAALDLPSQTDVEVPDGEVCFVAQKSVLAKLS